RSGGNRTTDRRTEHTSVQPPAAPAGAADLAGRAVAAAIAPPGGARPSREELPPSQPPEPDQRRGHRLAARGHLPAVSRETSTEPNGNAGCPLEGDTRRSAGQSGGGG